MIQGQGLDAYYALQDRVGRPVGERQSIDELHGRELIQQIERAESVPDVEFAETVFQLSGLSCVGCVWLVERLCQQEAQCLSASVSLQERSLRIRWRRGGLDVLRLAESLAQFGYRMQSRVARALPWSDIAWRLLLSGVFAMNAVLFSLPALLGLDATSYDALLQLLVVVFSLLSLLVGGSHYMLPSLRTLRLHGVHYDALIALGLGLLAGLQGLAAVRGEAQLWQLPVWIFALLLVRWIQISVWLKVSRRVQISEVNPAQTRQFQELNCIVLPAAFLLFALVAHGDSLRLASACLAPSFYFVAVACRYGLMGRLGLCLGYSVALIGGLLIAMGVLLPVSAPLWSLFCGLVPLCSLWLSSVRKSAEV